MVCGACKTGTSLHLNVFGNSGIHSYNNPIKTSLQHQLESEKVSPIILGNDGISQVMIKESLGWTSPEESTLNPLQILINAGVNPSSISLLLTMRNPLHVAVSWHKAYGHIIDSGTIVDNLSLAITSARRVYDLATEIGITHTSIHYETFKNNDPTSVISQVFGLFNIAMSATTNANWPSMIGHNHIHFFKKPERFKHKAYNEDTVRKTTNIQYFSPSEDEILKVFNAEELKKLATLRSKQVIGADTNSN